MPSFEPKHNAPRLRAYLKTLTGKRVLLMERSVWVRLQKYQRGEFEIDIVKFPMVDVNQITRVASIAKKLERDDYVIKIYREDLQDTKPINVDQYVLHDDFCTGLSFQELVKKASTSDDENMQRFLDECVIIEIKEHGKDHHLNYLDLPEIIKYKFTEQ